MSVSQDLMTAAVEAERRESVDRGPLSLALAGAELIDLVGAGAVGVDDGVIVPGPPTAEPDEELLRQAAGEVVRSEPYEAVEDWLWRRGRGLAEVYAEAFRAGGKVAVRRTRNPFRSGPVLTDEGQAARERLAAGDPVLAPLAAAAGFHAAGEEPGQPPEDAVGTVLAAVGDAVTELAAVRQQRDIEQAAFDNIWRGF